MGIYFIMIYYQSSFLWRSVSASILLSSLLLIPVISFSGYSFLFDMNTRLSPNDTLVGTYYFWWTNLTYLPLFFFTLLLYNLYTSFALNYFSLSIVLFLVYVFYPLELFDYLALNLHYFTSQYTNYGLNTLLTNTLNRYHPLVFYSSTSLIILAISSSSYFLYPRKCFEDVLHLRRPAFLVWLVVLINLIALWMGSWWALQEGTWGGWWNWDSSEVFGLVITLSALWVSHSGSSLTSLNSLFLKSRISFFIILLSYFFIQLNFDLVSHNFGAKFFFFFNNNLFFLEVLLASFIAVFTFFYTYSRSTKIVATFTRLVWTLNLQHLPTPRLLPFIIIVVWVLWSYRPLLNYFLWNFIAINVLNFEPSLQPINFLASLTLLTWLGQFTHSFYLVVLFLLANSSNWLILLLVLLQVRSRISALHGFLVGISLLNILLYDLSLVSWSSTPNYSYSFMTSTLLVEGSTLVTADSTSVEQSRSWTSFTEAPLVSWNIIAVSNSTAVNFFTLGLSHTFFDNYYYLSSAYTGIFLWLELPLVGTLNLFFWFALHLVFSQIKTRVQRHYL